MTQYYIMELQKYTDGSFGDIKHIAYDEDPTKARLKGEEDPYDYEELSARRQEARDRINELQAQLAELQK